MSDNKFKYFTTTTTSLVKANNKTDAQKLVVGSSPTLGAMTTYIKYATRSNDAVCQEHPSLEQALEFFLSPDGYRLDFLYPDGRVLYIHRAEYGEDLDSPFSDHAAFAHYSIANAKVMYYDPQSKNKPTTNVVPLFKKDLS